jgi:hypothetical protein
LYGSGQVVAIHDETVNPEHTDAWCVRLVIVEPIALVVRH